MATPTIPLSGALSIKDLAGNWRAPPSLFDKLTIPDDSARRYFRIPVEDASLPVESSVRIGPYVETVRLDKSTLTVSYRGPRLSRKVRRRLERMWADRLERLSWKLMGLSDPRDDPPLYSTMTRIPDTAAEPVRAPLWGAFYSGVTS